MLCLRRERDAQYCTQQFPLPMESLMEPHRQEKGLQQDGQGLAGLWEQRAAPRALGFHPH